MKLWRAMLLATIVVSVPILSGCDLLGLSDSKEKEREYYEQQLEAYRKVQEANAKAREAYNEQVRKGLEEWAKAYKEWQEADLQKQLKAMEEAEQQ